MKFSIAGKVYDAADLDRLSLKDILLFETQAAELGVIPELGRPMAWGDIGAISERIDALETDVEKENDRGMVWMTAVTIWASRKLAGEDVTFEQAVDFPMRDLKFIPEPQDHKTAKVNPTAARPGSGRAARAVAAVPPSATSSPETSEVESAAG